MIPRRIPLDCRKECAHRFARAKLHGYPALPAEVETEATLAAVPPEKVEKKPKGQELSA